MDIPNVNLDLRLRGLQKLPVSKFKSYILESEFVCSLHDESIFQCRVSTYYLVKQPFIKSALSNKWKVTEGYIVFVSFSTSQTGE